MDTRQRVAAVPLLPFMCAVFLWCGVAGACSNNPHSKVVDASLDGQPDAPLFDERVYVILSLEGNPETGAALFNLSCTGCHGKSGQGVPNQGIDIRDTVVDRGRGEVVRRMVDGVREERFDGLFMPSFAAVSDQNLADLLLHLQFGLSASSSE